MHSSNNEIISTNIAFISFAVHTRDIGMRKAMMIVKYTRIKSQ